MKKQFQAYLPHIISIVVLAICSVVYFLPQTQGKVLAMGDIVNYNNMVQEIAQHEEETGEASLWTNSIFCGMPTYQIKARSDSNLLKPIDKISRLGITGPIGYFFGGMVVFFLCMILLGINPWVSLVAALCFGFSTNNLVLYDAGHFTKVRTIFMIAPVITGVVLCYRKKYLLGGVIFAIGFGLSILMNHPQMTFYLGLTMLILVSLYLYEAIKNQELAHFAKASGILLFAMFLGMGSSASKLWTTYEYGEDTMRGKPILSKTDDFSSSSKDGLSWDYAMVYSNEKKDLLSGLMALAIGGGSSEMLSKDSATAKALRKKGANVRNGVPTPTYWGSLSINGGPQYFGAIVCLLFLLSMFVLKGPVRWYGLGAVLLTFFLSLGHNMEWFNRLLFDYVPLFNKFRTPNSVISVTAAIVPLIGFYGLHVYLKEKDRNLKPLMIATGILTAICVIFGLGGSAFFDYSSANDVRMEQMGYSIDALIADRKSMAMSSALRSIFLILIAAAAIYFYKIGKLKYGLTLAVLGVFAVFDLCSISSRYLSHDDFLSKRKNQENYQARPVDKEILQDKELYYRVLDLSINTFNSSQASYFHKTIGGYHAAKLQRMADIIDRHIMKNNQKVLNMLNTKYIISGSAQNPARAQVNPGAMGNAWFASNLIKVNSADEEIDALTGFDETKDVVVHKEFDGYLAGLNLQGQGTIELTKYAPNALEYQSTSSQEQLAVFSDVWYGPNKGWKAYIDDKPVDHIRANYLLRAMKIPAGSHKIRFQFDPDSYKTGELISLLCSGLMLLGLILLFIGYLKPSLLGKWGTRFTGAEG